MQQYDLDYLPISMVEPNETGPRKDPRDANWASMFLFGRWAWDGYLFGAQQTGTMFDKIDDTYTHGFERRKDVSDVDLQLRRLSARLLLQRLQRRVRQRRAAR